jgi:hypothetical protein
MNDVHIEHPLLLAMRDMKKTRMQAKALRILARIEHGIQNREKWIAARQAQQDALVTMQMEVLNAFDAGESLSDLEARVNAVVNSSEGQSPMEVQIMEIEAEEVEVSERTHPYFNRRK